MICFYRYFFSCFVSLTASYFTSIDGSCGSIDNLCHPAHVPGIICSQEENSETEVTQNGSPCPEQLKRHSNQQKGLSYYLINLYSLHILLKYFLLFSLIRYDLLNDTHKFITVLIGSSTNFLILYLPTSFNISI